MKLYFKICRRFLKLIGLMILCALTLETAHTETLRVAGSSTVYPFASVIAEQVGRATGKAPIVESTGSGAGMRSVCNTKSGSAVEIGNSSRRMTGSELRKCLKNHIQLHEFLIGRDGVVIAINKKNKDLHALSLAQIYLALAKQVPVGGKLVTNPHKKWRDIDPSLPAKKIHIYGPPPTSGTRDALQSLALEQGAKSFAFLRALRKSDKKQFKKITHTVRDDGYYIDTSENDNLMVRKLANEPDAIGIFGFSYLDNNSATLRGIKVDNFTPDFDNILDGKYSLTRPLYFYVRQNIWQKESVKAYMAEFINLKSIGEEGYLIDKGLIPLSLSEFQTQRAQLKNPKQLTISDLK